MPAALLEKFYGASVRADVVDRKVTRALTDYIVNNKVDILGEPMMNVESQVNFEKEDAYEFKFDLGLAPEFECKLDKRVKIPYYKIDVTEKMVEEQNAQLKKRYGKQVPGEHANEYALLRGSMVELEESGNAKEGGINVERTLIMPRYIKDDDVKAKLASSKVNDEIVFNPWTASGESVTEVASMLNIEKGEAENVKSDFKFVVNEILVNEDAEMNQEFFDMVLGKDEAKTEEEYLEKLKESIANQLAPDSNYRFTLDAERVLRKKVGELELPDEFLKRFMTARDKNHDAAKIEEKYNDEIAAPLQWQLIREKIARNLEVKLEDEDKMRLARYYAAQQFAQYGMRNMPEDVLNKYAHELLENAEFSEQIEHQAMDDKVYAAIKEAVTIDEKTVSLEEFNKLFEK